MQGTNWTCPFCNRPQTITGEQIYNHFDKINNNESKYGIIASVVETIRCANPDCLELALTMRLVGVKYKEGSGWNITDEYHHWSLLPESSAKPLPDYIPEAISENYYQACRIRDLSANASATMARRCLQGMIRDFCEIVRGRLFDEIVELKRLMDTGELPRHVSPDTVDAIDAVRKFGNIGAHMEKDINLIIDVEPGEAQTLIDLIELLIEEWYVQREKRGQRLIKIDAVVAAKEEAVVAAKEAKETAEPAASSAAPEKKTKSSE